MKFEWDLSKELENLDKHNFSFKDAIEAFNDHKGFVLEDNKHSNKENRYYWVGKNKKGIVLTVRFVRRGNTIRIFGCANWREFRSLYYEKTKNK